MDDLVESIGLEKVDFIKIDVESYELYVLRSAKKTIYEHKPIMLIEVFNKTKIEYLSF